MSIRLSIFTLLTGACLAGPVQADLVSLSYRQQTPAVPGLTAAAQAARSLEMLASPGNGSQAGVALDSGPVQDGDGAAAIGFGPAPLFFLTVETWRDSGQIGSSDTGLDLIDSMGFQDNAQPEGGSDLAGGVGGVHVAGSAPVSGGDGFVIAPLPPGALMGLATLVMFGARRTFRNRRGPSEGGIAQ